MTDIAEGSGSTWEDLHGDPRIVPGAVVVLGKHREVAGEDFVFRRNWRTATKAAMCGKRAVIRRVFPAGDMSDARTCEIENGEQDDYRARDMVFLPDSWQEALERCEELEPHHAYGDYRVGPTRQATIGGPNGGEFWEWIVRAGVARYEKGKTTRANYWLVFDRERLAKLLPAEKITMDVDDLIDTTRIGALPEWAKPNAYVRPIGGERYGVPGQIARLNGEVCSVAFHSGPEVFYSHKWLEPWVPRAGEFVLQKSGTICRVDMVVAAPNIKTTASGKSLASGQAWQAPVDELLPYAAPLAHDVGDWVKVTQGAHEGATLQIAHFAPNPDHNLHGYALTVSAFEHPCRYPEFDVEAAAAPTQEFELTLGDGIAATFTKAIKAAQRDGAAFVKHGNVTFQVHHTDTDVDQLVARLHRHMNREASQLTCGVEGCDGDLAGACEHCPDANPDRLHWNGRQYVPDGWEANLDPAALRTVWSKRHGK